MKENSGFTLIEFIIVIAILVVLFAAAIPKIISAVDSARIATDISSAVDISDALQTSMTKDNGVYRVGMIDVMFQLTSTKVGAIKVLIEDAAENIQSVPVIKHGVNAGDQFNVTIGDSADIIVKAGITQIYPKPEGDWAN